MSSIDNSSKNFRKSKYIATTPLRVVVKIISVIWLIEGLIMLTISYLPKMPELIEGIVDATALSVLSAVPIWFWIIRPLKMFAGHYLAHLESLEKAIDASAIVAVTDLTGKITHANSKFVEITGYSIDELLGKDHRILNSGYHSKEFFADLWKTISKGDVWRAEVKNKKKDGSFYWVDSTAVPMPNQKGKLSQYIAIRYDITERKLLEESLLRAKEEAENASQAKARFLANMSHEIRTPMNGIIGMSNLLLGSVTDPVAIERLKIIQNCSNSLLDLINDVLDFSKLEVDKVELEMQPFSLHATINEVLELLNTRASEKGVTLSYVQNPEVPAWIVGDVTRFRQVLSNLVSNSVKFTEAGSIVISSQATLLEANKWQLQFAIKDTGIGIPENIKNRLFRSFSQVDASTTRRFGGTGLGLAICKGLCEKMNGSIWVESVVGKGSTFFFTISAESAQPIETIQKSNPFSAFDPEMGQKNPLRILIAEDNRTNQLVALGLLGKLGYKADIAANGKEVLKCLEHQRYDLILMDCHMPEMDGFEATKKVFDLYTGPKRPKIIALTASTMKSDIDRCLAIGMDGFLGKPITISSLVKALSECIATPAFDRNAFLANFHGMEDLAIQTINSFLSTLPSVVSALEIAIQNRNAIDVELNAHTIKGVVSNFFAEPSRILALQLEQMGSANNLEQAEKLFMQLKDELQKLTEALNQETIIKRAV